MHLNKPILLQSSSDDCSVGRANIWPNIGLDVLAEWQLAEHWGRKTTNGYIIFNIKVCFFFYSNEKKWPNNFLIMAQPFHKIRQDSADMIKCQIKSSAGKRSTGREYFWHIVNSAIAITIFFCRIVLADRLVGIANIWSVVGSNVLAEWQLAEKCHLSAKS